MAATLHHNLTGVLTQELLAAGDNIKVNQISFVNKNNTACRFDLFIRKKLTGDFLLLKNYYLEASSNFIHTPIKFNNAKGEFSLFIKLIATSGVTPNVDVIISQFK